MQVKITVSVINLQSRADRRKNVIDEFKGKDEFDVSIVQACEHQVGAIGLWQSIQKIVKSHLNISDDYIIICEDDHVFTENYSRDRFFKCIEQAKINDADILSGGVSWLNSMVPVTDDIFWLQRFTGTQFFVIFKKFFHSILSAKFNTSDTADYKISELSSNKFCIYPFISTQKEFGYSDVTPKNNIEYRVEDLFKKSIASVAILQEVSNYYKKLGPNNINLGSDDIQIPVYVLCSSERIKQKEHVLNEFKHRTEFDVRFVEEQTTFSNSELWSGICRIVRSADESDDDVIVICTDDHAFTMSYSKEFFLKNVIQSHNCGTDYLCGEATQFSHLVKISNNLYWIGTCSAIRFLVIYRKFFPRILSTAYPAGEHVGHFLSELTSNKMIFYPFISQQQNLDKTRTERANDKIAYLSPVPCLAELQEIENAYQRFK